MIPTSFDYARANTLREALSALAQGDGTKVIAGGHSLLPMMRFRLVQAPRLVDISRLEELKGIDTWKKGLRIGATATYTDILESPLVTERCPVLHEVVGALADIQVRNCGTLGGALAHADPASDTPALMLALGAEFQLRSKKGKRTVKAADFFQGPFTTALAEDELLTGICIPGMGKAHAAYVSFDSAASGYAIAGACAVVERSRSTVKAVTVAFTGVGDVAFLAPEFGKLVGTKLDRAVLEEAARLALVGKEIAGDVQAPAEYRRHLGQVAARRAVETAYERAGA
jgi:carbon-monoxide dehydrogenase medium subunit